MTIDIMLSNPVGGNYPPAFHRERIYPQPLCHSSQGDGGAHTLAMKRRQQNVTFVLSLLCCPCGLVGHWRAGDFEGGTFQTLEADGQLQPYQFELGDALVFVSHKYHCVAPVTDGRRRVLVTELYTGGGSGEGEGEGEGGA